MGCFDDLFQFHIRTHINKDRRQDLTLLLFFCQERTLFFCSEKNIIFRFRRKIHRTVQCGSRLSHLRDDRIFFSEKTYHAVLDRDAASDDNLISRKLFTVFLLDPGTYNEIRLRIEKYDLYFTAAAIRRKRLQETLRCDLRDPVDRRDLLIDRRIEIK